MGYAGLMVLEAMLEGSHGREAIREKTRLGLSTISTALKRLEAAGFIQRAWGHLEPIGPTAGR